MTASPLIATAPRLAGPSDHPVIAMPFHVEIDGRQYRGRGISFVQADISGLMDPHVAGLERMAWVVFQFQGFSVGLSIEVRFQDVDVPKGTATLAFLDPTGEHLPQLRHLMNAHIAGDLVTMGQAMAVRPDLGSRPRADHPPRRLRRFGGSVLLLMLTLALLGLVAERVFQRVFIHHLAAPVLVGVEGRTLAATSTGQIDFLNPAARAGEVAFAIRANTGQTLSIAMPCDCKVEVLGVAAGSTVFAGDPVLRVAERDARLVLTGYVPPEEVLDLVRASALVLRFADGSEVPARLAPNGIGSAAPGEPVPFRLVPVDPLPESRAGQLAQLTLRLPVPDIFGPVVQVVDRLTTADRAEAP